ncbi:MAG: bifunctional nuclease family protein [Bacteroidota bacterium]
MDKKELHIIALSKSKSSPQNYVLILEEKSGFRRIPIIIGAFEAQAIAISIEDMKTDRPQTHDLLLTALELGQRTLKEIVISAYEDDVFHASLVLTHEGKETILDARSSDAIALAIRKACPIFTYESIIEKAGIVLDSPSKSFGEKRSLDKYSLKELESLLEAVLKKEDYESARKIKDVIKKKTG